MGGALAVYRRARPVVGPSNVTVLAEGNHRLNGKSHTRLGLTNSLVLGVVGDVRRAVEELVDSVSAVGADYAAVTGLGMLLNDVAKLTEENTWLNGLDGKVQALSRALSDTDGVRISLGLITNVVSLVEISVVALVVKSNINVEDVTILQHSLIGDAVTDDLVRRCADRLGEVVVV